MFEIDERTPENEKMLFALHVQETVESNKRIPKKEKMMYAKMFSQFNWSKFTDVLYKDLRVLHITPPEYIVYKPIFERDSKKLMTEFIDIMLDFIDDNGSNLYDALKRCNTSYDTFFETLLKAKFDFYYLMEKGLIRS